MPLHKNRTWVVVPVGSALELADILIGRSWCSCAGWSLNGYLFLNDQTSEDGAFEVAIVKPPAEKGGQWYQVESVTFGWMSSTMVLTQHWREHGERVTPQQLAIRQIEACISGKCDPGVEGSVAWEIEALDVETPQQHGRCYLCA